MTQLYGHLPFSAASIFVFIMATWILISNNKKVQYERKFLFFSVITWFYLNSIWMMVVYFNLFEKHQLFLFIGIQTVSVILYLVGIIIFQIRKRNKKIE